MTKICEKCSIEKNIDLFYKKSKRITSQCKECRNAFMRDYYKNNREKHYSLIKKRRNQYALEVDKFILEAKNKPCMDCKQVYHPFVMDFDHRDPTDKVESISKISNRGYSLDNIKKEIDKCDLVCSNCHRMRTLAKSKNNTKRRYKI